MLICGVFIITCVGKTRRGVSAINIASMQFWRG
jgi:hypothetical protein